MNRKNKIFSIYVVHFLIFYYIAYSFNVSANEVDYVQLVNSYVNNIQTYFFSIMLVICMYLSVTGDPYLNGEFRIRYSSNLFVILMERGAWISFKWTSYTFVLIIIVPLLLGYRIDLIPFNLNDFFRMFTFIFSIFIVVNLLYVLSKKVLLAVILTGVLYFLVLSFYLAYTFFVIVELVPDEIALSGMIIGCSLINILGMGSLYLNFKYRDCIS